MIAESATMMREGDDNPDEGGYWQIPPDWPTHKGSEALWEELGRTVATFGMLEDTLARAYFHVTGQQQLIEGVDPKEQLPKEQLEAWAADLIGRLPETLKPLADRMKAAWKALDGELTERRAAMADEIKILADERNRLCHGAWVAFNEPDRGTVRYFPRKFDVGEIFLDTRSVEDLAGVRRRVTALISEIIADTQTRTNRPFAT